MNGMNGTELHEWALIENGRIRDKVHAELAAHAREFLRVFMAYRLLVPRPSLQTLAEWNADEQYGHEWRMNAARTDEELIAVYQTQLADYAVTKERLARERILLDDARREIEALREERDTLAAKLDAANAKLAALENAALVADATLGDKPRKVWTEDVKRAILTALVEAPRNLSEMRADGWMAEVPDRQFAACILEMSRTWQLMRPVPGAPEGTYELTPDGADSARAMLADADDDVTVALMDERARPPMKLTPPARKPDAAA